MAKIKIERLDLKELKNKGINNWPIWEKEISKFDWYYDSIEECFFLEGEVDVETSEGTYCLKAGDFVTFSEGLKCVWNVKKPVRKHYNFK
ncbi:MAG: cupin domain-containing protein [Bacteroidia bacterium]|nr:cupin domain-containing protein [Bacteroidia bacterium]